MIVYGSVPSLKREQQQPTTPLLRQFGNDILFEILTNYSEIFVDDVPSTSSNPEVIFRDDVLSTSSNPGVIFRDNATSTSSNSVRVKNEQFICLNFVTIVKDRNLFSGNLMRINSMRFGTVTVDSTTGYQLYEEVRKFVQSSKQSFSEQSAFGSLTDNIYIYFFFFFFFC